MRLVDIEPIVELVKGEHEKVQTRFNEANVFKEPNDVALWGAVLQEVGAFIGLMINAPTVDAIPVSFINEQIENLQGIADYEFIESGGYIGTCNHELGALQDLLKHWTERKEE